MWTLSGKKIIPIAVYLFARVWPAVLLALRRRNQNLFPAAGSVPRLRGSVAFLARGKSFLFASPLC